MINDGSTAFGCLPGECKYRRHYAGSWSDFGSIPAAIDFVGFDLYTGQTCFNTAAGGSCGYEINPADCMLRECEPQAVMPWIYERVFPLLSSHQSVWLIPGTKSLQATAFSATEPFDIYLFVQGSFGAPPTIAADAGNMTHQEDMLLLQLEGYWAWMQAEPRISGMFPCESHPCEMV